MDDSDLENQGSGPVDGSEALAPPKVMGNNHSSQFLRARLAEGLSVDQAREKLREWRKEQASFTQEVPKPLIPRIIRAPKNEHPIWEAILGLMQQRHDQNGTYPSQVEMAVALNKSQAWVSQQMVLMESVGLIKRLGHRRGYQVLGDLKPQLSRNYAVFVPIFGEDLKVPLPEHWIQQPCFLFKPENMIPAVLDGGVTPGCWVLVQRQTIAEEMDIVAYYENPWGLRLMEYGPAVMGQIEGKVIMVIKEKP